MGLWRGLLQQRLHPRPVTACTFWSTWGKTLVSASDVGECIGARRRPRPSLLANAVAALASPYLLLSSSESLAVPLVGVAYGTAVHLPDHHCCGCLPLKDRGVEVLAVPPPGPCVSWTRLTRGAAETTEGHVSIRLLERAAEAAAVLLEAARRAVLLSTSRPAPIVCLPDGAAKATKPRRCLTVYPLVEVA